MIQQSILRNKACHLNQIRTKATISNNKVLRTISKEDHLERNWAKSQECNEFFKSKVLT